MYCTQGSTRWHVYNYLLFYVFCFIKEKSNCCQESFYVFLNCLAGQINHMACGSNNAPHSWPRHCLGLSCAFWGHHKQTHHNHYCSKGLNDQINWVPLGLSCDINIKGLPWILFYSIHRYIIQHFPTKLQAPNYMSIIDDQLLCNGTYMCTRTLTAGQPIFRLIHNSSSCQSQVTTGCLLLLLEQYIKTQRDTCYPSPGYQDAVCLSLPHPPFIFPAFFLSLTFSFIFSLPRCGFCGGGDFSIV